MCTSADNVIYVSGPAIAQVALIRFWAEEPDEIKRILAKPGKFYEAMLQAVNQLAPGPEKEVMLGFFSLPQASFGFSELMDAKSGGHFLQLLTADPETYLPRLHRIFSENWNQLESMSYETRGTGRRDIIWRVRDLAQFVEFFEQAEEIVHWLALKEIPSPYMNVASTYWADWFKAYFDFTEYPYEKRLDLLESRIATGNDHECRLIVSAIGHPFPHSSSNVPSSIVGGRISPPSLQLIHHRQIALAAQRIPDLLCKILEVASEQVRMDLGKAIRKARTAWFDHLHSIDSYLKVVTHPLFPEDSRLEIIVDARHYVILTASEENQRQSQMRAKNLELLDRIDQADLIVDVLMLADHAFYHKNDQAETEKVQQRVLQGCQQDPDFLAQVIKTLSVPERHGGWRIGILLGAEVDRATLEQVLHDLMKSGPCPFALGMISGYVNSHPEHTDWVLRPVRDLEESNPSWSLSVYQAIGEETYLQESARMLKTTDVSASLLAFGWREIDIPLKDYVKGFIEAIGLRLRNGDPDAVGPALDIVNYVKSLTGAHEAFR